MLKFTDIPIENPTKESSNQRKKHFNEIYANYAKNKAAEQASRCSQCGVPFCQIHCPLHNNIPDWLLLTAENRLEEAFELSSSTNNMPEVCGRVCPQDRLCEGNCVIEQAGHDTVTIGSIEKYITDYAWENGWIKPIKVNLERNQSVGIIGAGPSGLAAAEELRKRGYKIIVYDRYDRAGGLLMYGIPNFKLEKEIVLKRTNRLMESGIEFKLNCEVGSNTSFQNLKDKHDAVLIATGVYKPHSIDLNKNNASNVVPAMEFLTASNRKGLNDRVEDFDNGRLNCFNKKVLVVGGGDTAMDCVRTAIRQDPASVKCLYRRDQQNMPGSQRDVFNAIEEGIEFDWLTLPINYIGNKKVKTVKVIKMQLGSPDETGRKHPEQISGTEYEINSDIVIEALGFDPENIPQIFNEPDLQVNQLGTIKIDFNNMMTKINGLFAAGDIVRGASLVVWGIKDGRDAANNIHNYLKEKSSLFANHSTEK